MITRKIDFLYFAVWSDNDLFSRQWCIYDVVYGQVINQMQGATRQ